MNKQLEALNRIIDQMPEEQQKVISDNAVNVPERKDLAVDVVPIMAVSAADLYRMEIPPIEWRLESVLPMGVVAMLSAKPKSFKSFLALGACIAICQGKPYLGFQSEKCGCLYFDLEGGYRRMKSRLKLMLQEEDPPENLYLITRDDLPSRKLPKLHEDFEPLLLDQLELHPDVGMVVIDVFAKIRKRKKASDDSYERDYADLDPLMMIAEKNNITILLISHHTKGKQEDPFDNTIGSAGIMGALDVAWSITKGKRSDENATLNITGRDLETQELSMYFDDKKTFRWYLIGTKEEVEAQKLRQEYYDSNIVRVIKQGIRERCGSFAASASDIIEYGSQHNLPVNVNVQQIGLFINKYRDAGIFEEDGIHVLLPTNTHSRKYLFAKN